MVLLDKVITRSFLRFKTKLSQDFHCAIAKKMANLQTVLHVLNDICLAVSLSYL